MTETYDLSIPDAYGSYDTLSFDSVYDAQESLLDALDRVASPGSGWQLQALLEEVEADIRAMEEEGEE